MERTRIPLVLLALALGAVSLEGAPARMSATGDYKLPEKTYVVSDVPGYNSWPMIQAVGTKLFCSYSRDNARPPDGHTISPGSRDSYLRFSLDGGRTWSDETVVADDPKIGEVNEGIGLDETGAAILWVRCWGKDRRHELYRTVDGKAIEKIAAIRPDPFPMQIMDPVRVEGLGLVSPWFAGNYRENGANCWGLFVSADNGRTWTQRIIEKELPLKEWVTEPSLVDLGGGRLLIVGRCEKSLGNQFQVTSVDGGKTWKKARTNIGDVRESTPSLVYDATYGLVANYYYHRGARQLKRRVVQADFIFDHPDRWPEPEILAAGFEQRPHDAGNVKTTRLGDKDCCAWYTGTPSNATVVVTVVPKPKALARGADARVGMECVAHRGYWNSAIPENTVEAITRAYDYGADWVETDFNLMPDGKMLCYHDVKTRDRVIKPPFHVPTLEEVLAVVPKDRHIQCEIKTYGKEYAAKFDAAVKAAGLTPDNIIVSCFNPTSLKDFKRRMPQYRTLWLISPKRLDNKGKGIEVGRLIATAKDIGAFAMCPGAKGAYKAKWSRADADRIRASGFSFRFFGVNEPQMLAYAAELGVEAFTCNYYEDAFLWARENGVRLNPPKERKPNLSAAFPANATSSAYGVERVGGVPRFTRDGKPFAATAVMPSPAAKPGAAQEVLKSFRAAGIRLASDVWTMHDKRYTPRQWWLDDGEYDFAQFDALAHGLTDAADDELIFPRIKIDPPAKWSAAHPEEMMDEISPHPESAAWRALYRRMLKDVIEHVEKSDYADRVIGYHIGAFHCGEWLTGEWKSPNHRAYIAPVSCATRDALPPRSLTASRRASLACRSTAVADMLIDVATCVKEYTHGRKLVGAFFGYPSIAHEKLSRVLQSGKVDFVAAPPYYGNFREPGQAGRSQAYYQASYRLHNMVFFEESDFRTFLSEPAFAPPRQTRRRPLDESLALVRRSIGKSLAGGWENWWFLLGGNNTFSAPELMASIRVGAAEAAATLATARWAPAEVAVFTAADEYVTSGRTHVSRMAEWGKSRLHKEVLPVCGVPIDSYELSDIADPRLPDYKVYVFPNAITLSDATKAKIKERVRRAGKTAIWVFAPGYYDEHGEGNVANVEELTGVAVAPRPLTGDHPCDKMLAPVGSAVCEREGWRSVFVSLPPDAAALRAAFREAGAHVWMETDDVLAAGRGYVMVHAASDGEKTIRLPGSFDAREIFDASPVRKDVSEIVETMKRGETRVWHLGK